MIDRVRLQLAGYCLGVVVLCLFARPAQPGDAVPGKLAVASCDARMMDPPEYGVVALPLVPAAINDEGLVAGTTEMHRAAIWSSRQGLTLLPLPESFAFSDAVAVNSSGQVLVMAYDRALEHRQAYVFHRGKLRSLTGGQPRAFHINDAGLVVGEALVNGKPRTEPVLWTAAGLQSMGACCGGTAKAINRSGSAVGDVYDERGQYAAFRWDPAGGIERIGPPGGFSSALAINDLGHVLIDTFPSIRLYASGQLVAMQLAHKLPSHPHALNNCDVVVGEFGPFSDKDLAFRWTPAGGFRDLNSLIAANSGWKLEAAAAINNRGAIVGRGDFRHEDDHGYMLVPERTPSAP